MEQILAKLIEPDNTAITQVMYLNLPFQTMIITFASFEPAYSANITLLNTENYS